MEVEEQQKDYTKPKLSNCSSLLSVFHVLHLNVNAYYSSTIHLKANFILIFVASLIHCSYVARKHTNFQRRLRVNICWLNIITKIL